MKFYQSLWGVWLVKDWYKYVESHEKTGWMKPEKAGQS